MSIIEAIKHAENEHAVYLLLTAYLESLWSSENDSTLRGSLRRLPIEGQTDVEERAQALASEEGVNEVPVVAEAAEIFRAARERLGAGQAIGTRSPDTSGNTSRASL